MNSNQCVCCGGTVEQVAETSWDQLNAYRFTPYPDDLLIITNAPKEAFDKAVERFGDDNQEPQNIDAILQEMGFVALCASNPPVHIPF